MDEEEYLPFGTTNPVGDENRAILIKKEKNYNLTRMCVIFLCLILFFLGFFTYKLYEKSMRESCSKAMDVERRCCYDKNDDHYCGEWSSNQKNGKGVMIYSNGTFWMGTFRNNERIDGEGYELDKNLTKIEKNTGRTNLESKLLLMLILVVISIV